MRGVWDFLVAVVLSVSELTREFAAKRRNRRFLFLLPALLVLALVMAVIGSAGVLAPFVYPLF
jgi:hypothetical protein